MKSLALALVVLTSCSTDTFVGPDGSVGDSSVGDAPAGDGGEGGGGGGDASCTPQAVACPSGDRCSSFDLQPGFAPFGDASLNGGTVALTTDQFFSCPHAVVATAPAQTGGQARGAIGATTTLTGVALAHARVELDVLLPKIVTGPTAFIFVYANNDTNNGIGLVWQSGNWTVRDSLSGQETGIDPRVGTWNHVALDVTFSPSSNLGKVEIDFTDASGKQQVQSFNSPTLASATISSLAFIAGVVPVATTAAPMTTYLDDVVFSNN